MKKVLALVLAVLMLATTAFALDIGIGGVGTALTDVEPGDSIKIYPTAFGLNANTTFTSEYFTITAKKFTKGADMVKEVKWNDDDECVEIALKQDYTLQAPEKANLVLDVLKIKCKKDVKVGGVKLANKNHTYEYDKTMGTNFFVGYLLGEVTIADDFDVKILDSGWVDTADIANIVGTPTGRAISDVKLVKFVAGDKYGTANISFGDIAYASGRVYEKNKVNLGFDKKVNVDIIKKYPDADLTFVNLHAEFDGNMDFELYADEESYVYALKDGKLSATNLKWDDDAYAFTGKVRTLGSYVISDTKLATEAAGTTNPDTGANDVVGIATALAAVALVSAAAVSLKK